MADLKTVLSEITSSPSDLTSWLQVAHQSDGTLVTAQVQAALGGSQTRLAGVSKGAVCFCWDDGFSEHYSAVAPLHDSYGQKATFCIISDQLDQAGRLTSAQVLALYNDGHEIACHSKTHGNISGMTAANRLIEYETSRTAIEAVTGAGTLKSFVYPGGYPNRSTTTDAELYLRYDRIRSTSLQGITGGGQPPFYVANGQEMRPAFLTGAWPWGAVNSHGSLLELIKRAAIRPIIVVVYAHQPDSASNPTTAQIQEALALCNTLNVPCLTLKEAFPAEPTLIDPGFELYAIASDGSTNVAWQWQGTASETAEAIADTADVNMQGTQSLHLKVATGTNNAWVTQGFPVVPGRTYTISGRYRVAGSPGTGVTVRVNQRDSYAASISNTATVALTSVTWATFSVDVIAAANAATMHVQPIVLSVVAEMWVDHIHVGLKADGIFG